LLILGGVVCGVVLILGQPFLILGLLLFQGMFGGGRGGLRRRVIGRPQGGDQPKYNCRNFQVSCFHNNVQNIQTRLRGKTRRRLLRYSRLSAQAFILSRIISEWPARFRTRLQMLLRFVFDFRLSGAGKPATLFADGCTG
jgi:hypothetical protein